LALWTQADIDSLKAAVASGVLTVTFDGPPRRSVTYQSLDSMRSLLASMVQEVAAASGSPTSYRFASTSKGL
jgi:hypothetical protein